MSENTNKRIGDYEIIRELGHGGMGRVYLVRNVLSDRIEATKVVLLLEKTDTLRGGREETRDWFFTWLACQL